MMRSLYSGVAGLRSHQTRMDVIGNNIANVNTVGYKSQSVTFSDVLYQTTQNASGPNETTGAGGTNAKQIGLGSTISSISTNITETGGYQTTNKPFDLMINGDSFFVVNNNGSNYFTKAGNFQLDTNGMLVTSQGYAVMGWLADKDGNIQVDNVSRINLYSPENQYADPVATTATTMAGNINKEDESFSAAGGSRSVNISFYDNLGYKYQATLKVTQTSEYEYGMTVSAVSCNGRTLNLSETDLNNLLDANTSITFNEADGTLATPADGIINFKATALGIDALPQDITVDFSSVTCRGTETKLEASRGDADGNGAGRAVGTMTEVAIGKDGKISASYDNGDQRVIAQIAVANFVNPSGLEKIGDNLFQATMNSGEFMITTQRGYQANSRIITVSDTLLEELINLKR